MIAAGGGGWFNGGEGLLVNWRIQRPLAKDRPSILYEGEFRQI